MKIVAACASVLVFWATVACAQSDVMIRQKAKDLSNQNNARQGVPTAPAPANPSTAPVVAPPAAPRPPSVQQQNIARLKADVANSHRGGTPTDKAKQDFAKDLLAAAQGTGKPSTNSLSRLADDLLNALAAKKVTTAADEQLVSKIVILLNSAGLSATRTDQLAHEAETVLQSAGVPAADAAKVAADLQSVTADVQHTARL